MANTSLAHAVRALRRGLKQTQKQFADSILVSESSILKYESGAQSPKSSVLRTLHSLANREGQHDLKSVFAGALATRAQSIPEPSQASSRSQLANFAVDLSSTGQQSSQRKGLGNLLTGSEKEGWFSHRILWTAASHQLALATRLRLPDPLLFMNACVVAAASVEAYTEYLRPAVRIGERDTQDASGWLKDLYDRFSEDVIAEDERPFASIKSLLRLRNQLVHGFVGESSESVERRLQKASRSFEVELIFSDVEEFLEGIHQLARTNGNIHSLPKHALKVQD